MPRSAAARLEIKDIGGAAAEKCHFFRFSAAAAARKKLYIVVGWTFSFFFQKIFQF
jgi:hypothetical protein